MKYNIFLLIFVLFTSVDLYAQRQERLLEKNWKFFRGDAPEAVGVNFDDSGWQSVAIPHDWAIYGPFDRENDLQNVAVTQNQEWRASLRWCQLVPYPVCPICR
jgi:beta-galactosidase